MATDAELHEAAEKLKAFAADRAREVAARVQARAKAREAASVVTPVVAPAPAPAPVVVTEIAAAEEYRPDPASPEMMDVIRSMTLTPKRKIEIEKYRAKVVEDERRLARRLDREARKRAADLAPKKLTTSQKRRLKCLVEPEISVLKSIVEHPGEVSKARGAIDFSTETQTKIDSDVTSKTSKINSLDNSDARIPRRRSETASPYIEEEDTKLILKHKSYGETYCETSGASAPEDAARSARSSSKSEEPCRDGSSLSGVVSAEITTPVTPRLRRGRTAYEHLPLETRAGLQLDGLRSLAPVFTGCFDVAIALDPPAECIARGLAPSKRLSEPCQRQTPVSLVRRQLTQKFAALGLPCLFLIILREIYVGDDTEFERRRKIGLSRYRLEVRMTCILPISPKTRRAFQERLVAHFGAHATDDCVRLRPHKADNSFLMPDLIRHRQHPGPIQTPGRDKRRFTGRSFDGPVIAMTDDVANAGKLAYEASATA